MWPFRVRLVRILPGLAEIESSHNPDTAGVRLFENFAERIVARRNGGAHVVVLHLARIVGRDSAQGHEEHIRVEVRHLPDKLAGLERGVGLPEIGLKPADGFAHPPALLALA